MTKIGVYDSGIGGLTTVAKLYINFPFCDFLFYVDNASFPLGNKNENELARAVEEGIFFLKQRCDFAVLACNTASSIAKDTDVYKLLPPLSAFPPDKTLVLATPNTLKNLKIKESGYKTAETADLAENITEMYLAPNLEHREETRIDVEKNLRAQLEKLDFENVLIGCSHYMFIEDFLKTIYPDKTFADGNGSIIRDLKKCVKTEERIGDIDFEFSGENELESYVAILENLLLTYRRKQD